MEASSRRDPQDRHVPPPATHLRACSEDRFDVSCSPNVIIPSDGAARRAKTHQRVSTEQLQAVASPHLGGPGVARCYPQPAASPATEGRAAPEDRSRTATPGTDRADCISPASPDAPTPAAPSPKLRMQGSAIPASEYSDVDVTPGHTPRRAHATGATGSGDYVAA